MKPRPSASSNEDSSAEEGLGNGTGSATVVKIEWVPEEEEEAAQASGGGDAESHQEDEADWGCEDDETVARDENYVEKESDGLTKEVENEESDTNKENDLQEATEDAPDDDAPDEGADVGASPEAAVPDEAASTSPLRCLGVLKMHNPKRDFGFISPLLSIPKSVPLPKGAEGLWFFGAPKLQDKGPLVGCEVLFNVCTGKDGQSKTQAVDIVLADEEEGEIGKADVAHNAPVRPNIKQELFEADKADEEHATASAHVAPSDLPRQNIKQELTEVEARHATGHTERSSNREPHRPNIKQELTEAEQTRKIGHPTASDRQPPAPISTEQKLAEAKTGSEMETGVSDASEKPHKSNEGVPDVSEKPYKSHGGVPDASEKPYKSYEEPKKSYEKPLPPQHRERFAPKEVKGETWSSNVGFTRVKIEYRESAEIKKSRAMEGSVQNEPRSSKTEEQERVEAFPQSAVPRMEVPAAGQSAAYRPAEAPQPFDPAAKAPFQEADGMQRLRSLVEEGPYYKCFPCKAAMKGQCLVGSACPDAHTLQEVRPLPDTKLVRKIAKRNSMDFFQQPVMPMNMMWGMPSMGMGMPPFGVPPLGAFPPYVEMRPKKKKKKSRYSD